MFPAKFMHIIYGSWTHRTPLFPVSEENSLIHHHVPHPLELRLSYEYTRPQNVASTTLGCRMWPVAPFIKRQNVASSTVHQAAECGQQHLASGGRSVCPASENIKLQRVITGLRHCTSGCRVWPVTTYTRLQTMTSVTAHQAAEFGRQ